jgi:hypothetical protein
MCGDRCRKCYSAFYCKKDCVTTFGGRRRSRHGGPAECTPQSRAKPRPRFPAHCRRASDPSKEPMRQLREGTAVKAAKKIVMFSVLTLMLGVTGLLGATTTFAKDVKDLKKPPPSAQCLGQCAKSLDACKNSGKSGCDDNSEQIATVAARARTAPLVAIRTRRGPIQPRNCRGGARSRHIRPRRIGISGSREWPTVCEWRARVDIRRRRGRCGGHADAAKSQIGIAASAILRTE